MEKSVVSIKNLDENLKLPPLYNSEFDSFPSIHSQIAEKMQKSFEDVFIEGLKRKGYLFDNKFELEEFVKEKCTVEIRDDINEKTYTVDGVPFLVHKEEINVVPNFIDDERGMTVICDYGQYKFL